MKDNPIALVVSDVDGTLLTSSKTLSPRNRAAVLMLATRNIPFTIISSRPPFGLRMLIEPLNLRLPMAAFNGAALVTPELSLIARQPLGSDPARRALACFEEFGLDAWLFTEDHWHIRNPNGPYVELEIRTVQTPPTIVDNFAPLYERALKIVGVSSDFDRLGLCAAKAKRELEGIATVSRSQPYYLDVTAPQLDKGVALGELARRQGIDLAGVVTLGDMENDVPMFRRSGFSVAMGNGSPAAREAASVVTSSNDADGFAEAIERYILPRAPIA